jgi:predicted dehydrogenase
VPALLQVGLGAWGLDWATKVLPEVPEMELVACVDARPEALEAACDAGAITARQCYSSIADAIEDQKTDAVLVTTDGAQHGDVVRAALRARKHVLVEKPFVESMAEARELVDEAAALDRTLMVSQNYRFFPAVRAAQRIVKGQELGQLLHVDIDFRRFAHVSHRLHWRHPLLLDMGQCRIGLPCRTSSCLIEPVPWMPSRERWRPGRLRRARQGRTWGVSRSRSARYGPLNAGNPCS